jgi:hypothetical protein
MDGPGEASRPKLSGACESASVFDDARPSSFGADVVALGGGNGGADSTGGNPLQSVDSAPASRAVARRHVEDDVISSDDDDLSGDEAAALDAPSLFDSFTPSHKDFWHMAATMDTDDGLQSDNAYDAFDDANRGGHDGHSSCACSICECVDGECACFRTSWRLVKRRLKTTAVIVIVGAVSTGLAIGLDAALAVIENATEKVMRDRNVTLYAPEAGQGYSIFATYCVLLPCFLVPLLLAIAVTALVSPSAAGSGIPGMKAVFGGVYLPRFLSLPTLLAKTVGLLGSVSSGLSVGTEGPFVHIACCIAAVLLRVPWFRYLNRNIVRRHGVLAMACVVGVVAAFGTPFGGLLFAVEVVATYFKISDLPQMFWAALVGVRPHLRACVRACVCFSLCMLRGRCNHCCCG